ncbi:hypothetical protein AK812_SmicGene9617 [Symbiodinium microadriaticum]|uniref:Uncharacterized protein n=1 Tax=Symbiodinium microadriaticum TaxID=2951 RepID=A0A1Q9EHY5_SYMMI|nr:hypothetical protein AK812_SmicGene9617 [Symbiodinium microadriaticum]
MWDAKWDGVASAHVRQRILPQVGLLHVIDDAWKAQALPEDDLVLPEGHQINLDESDDKTPEMERSEERWLGGSDCLLLCELPLTHFLEEEAEAGANMRIICGMWKEMEAGYTRHQGCGWKVQSTGDTGDMIGAIRSVVFLVSLMRPYATGHSDGFDYCRLRTWTSKAPRRVPALELLALPQPGASARVGKSAGLQRRADVNKRLQGREVVVLLEDPKMFQMRDNGNQAKSDETRQPNEIGLQRTGRHGCGAEVDAYGDHHLACPYASLLPHRGIAGFKSLARLLARRAGSCRSSGLCALQRRQSTLTTVAIDFVVYEATTLKEACCCDEAVVSPCALTRAGRPVPGADTWARAALVAVHRQIRNSPAQGRNGWLSSPLKVGPFDRRVRVIPLLSAPAPCVQRCADAYVSACRLPPTPAVATCPVAAVP